MKKTLFLSAMFAMAMTSAYATDPDRTVHVATAEGEGDVVGTPESPYQLGFNQNNGFSVALTLNDGTAISNSEGNANMNVNWKQIDSITLAGEASTATLNVTENRNYGFLGGGHTQTSLSLNGGTLLKTGAGAFTFVNAVQTSGDTGTIDVKEGGLEIFNTKDVGLNASGLTVKLAQDTTMKVHQNSTIGSLEAGGTVTIDSGKTLTISKGSAWNSNGQITVTGGTISGDTITGATVSGQLKGGTISGGSYTDNDVRGGTLSGGVTLSANERLNVKGQSHVTLGDVVHNASAGANNYAVVIYESSELTINGTVDFTSKNWNMIGIENNSSLVIDNGGNVTSGNIGWSTNSMNGTASVNAGGTLNVKGSAYVKSFTNAGTTTMDGTVNANTITNNSGTLTAANLGAINNAANVTVNGGTVTVTGNAKIGSLNMTAGNLQVNGTTDAMTSVTLSGGTITLKEDHSGSLTTSALTVNKDATINADLVVSGTMTFATDAVLTMGCNVTIGSGTALVIADSVDTAPVTMFTGVDGLTLGTTEITKMGWYDANGILASINGTTIDSDGQYVIGFWNGDVSVAAASVPEPATTTLSLLALAGLCARRKRK